jgi:hypothetical protein
MGTECRYVGYTLIDITNTGVTSYTSATQKERNQQRNWETIFQVVSLRSTTSGFSYFGSEIEDVTKFSFGVNYSGNHRIWSFSFTSSDPAIYQIAQDRYGQLKDDFSIAPIILGLDETATPPMPLFYPSGPFRNVYFSMAK